MVFWWLIDGWMDFGWLVCLTPFLTQTSLIAINYVHICIFIWKNSFSLDSQCVLMCPLIVVIPLLFPFFVCACMIDTQDHHKTNKQSTILPKFHIIFFFFPRADEGSLIHSLYAGPSVFPNYYFHFLSIHPSLLVGGGGGSFCLFFLWVRARSEICVSGKRGRIVRSKETDTSFVDFVDFDCLFDSPLPPSPN